MESLDFRAARCLRSHLDQIIYFRVRDTKAREVKGWAQGHTAAKGQNQNRKLQFLVPWSSVLTQYLRGSTDMKILSGEGRFLLGFRTYFHLRSNSRLSNFVGGIAKTMKWCREPKSKQRVTWSEPQMSEPTPDLLVCITMASSVFSFARYYYIYRLIQSDVLMSWIVIDTYWIQWVLGKM